MTYRMIRRGSFLQRIGAAVFATAIGFSGVQAVSAAPIPTVAQHVQQISIQGQIVVDRVTAYGGPGTGFWRIATLRRGTSITVMGASGAFYKTMQNNRDAWVAKEAVTILSGESVPEIAVPPIGTVTVGNAALRNAPGIDATRKAVISNGEQFFIVGRQPDGLWLEVETRFGRGWIAASSTDAAGAPAAVTALPRVIVNAAFLNVRTGPGSEYTILGTLSGGDEVPIIGKTPDGVWLLVQTGVGAGWVRLRFVTTRDYFGNVPTVTDYSGARLDTTGRVLGIGAINLRTAPNAESPVVGVLYAGATVEVLGQSADRRWYYVKSDLGTGWVTKQYVSTTNAGRNAPVVN